MSDYELNIRIKQLVRTLEDSNFGIALSFGDKDGNLVSNVNSLFKLNYHDDSENVHNNVIYRKASEPFLPKADLILCSGVLEYIENDEVFMKRMYDALNPDGIFYVTALNSNIIDNVENEDIEDGYLRRYSVSDITSKMELVGFKTLQTHQIKSEHYYESKCGLGEYFVEVDRSDGIIGSSNLIYLGGKDF